MRVIAIIAGVVAALAVVGGASAKPSTWVPGSAYYISEEQAYDLLEQSYDHAYCNGVPRFGHRGAFPYDKYRVFDCDFYTRTASCSDYRFKSVKARRVNYFTLRVVAKGDCYST